jgi:hypothetical protein
LAALRAVHNHQPRILRRIGIREAFEHRKFLCSVRHADGEQNDLISGFCRVLKKAGLA